MGDNLGSSEPLLEDLEGQGVWQSPPQLEASSGGRACCQRRRRRGNQRLVGELPPLAYQTAKLCQHYLCKLLPPCRMWRGR